MPVVVQGNRTAQAPRGDLPMALRFVGSCLPAIISGLMLLAGLLLLARRLAGAFDQALPASALWLSGAALAGGSELLRQCLSSESRILSSPNAAQRRRFRLMAWLPVASVWLIGAGISLPASSPLGLAGLWGFLIAEGLRAVWQERSRRITRLFFPAEVRSLAASSANASSTAGSQVDASASDTGIGGLADEESELPPDDVVQQLVRRHEADGGEWMTGLVRVAFTPGQKTAYAHVAFCPPFLTVPSCEAEPISGPDAQIKVAQVLPQGVRFEIRLDAAEAEPASVLLEFAAHWLPAAE